jgi:hypothetical protein
MSKKLNYRFAFVVGFIEAMLFHNWWILLVLIVLDLIVEGLWKLGKIYDIPAKIKAEVKS